ncbi:unnamed protein product [Haemonchus placei]|uniref:Uncharacterized protein n=1 Tax=Haemonchus placei TaxID=6290 RepID=A0A3P7VZX9_HAEPC|nr:unnamed protein product [Haemonchus placei]
MIRRTPLIDTPTKATAVAVSEVVTSHVAPPRSTSEQLAFDS